MIRTTYRCIRQIRLNLTRRRDVLEHHEDCRVELISCRAIGDRDKERYLRVCERMRLLGIVGTEGFTSGFRRMEQRESFGGFRVGGILVGYISSSVPMTIVASKGRGSPALHNLDLRPIPFDVLLVQDRHRLG